MKQTKQKIMEEISLRDNKEKNEREVRKEFFNNLIFLLIILVVINGFFMIADNFFIKVVFIFFITGLILMIISLIWEYSNRIERRLKEND